MASVALCSRRLLEEGMDGLRRFKRERRRISYDDLLSNLHAALADPELGVAGGRRAARALSGRADRRIPGRGSPPDLGVRHHRSGQRRPDVPRRRSQAG
jgi:hypothetical protein